MRRCYLCGSIIRKRAEFCRYCNVRQRDRQQSSKDDTASPKPGTGEHGGAPAPTTAPDHPAPDHPAPDQAAPVEPARTFTPPPMPPPTPASPGPGRSIMPPPMPPPLPPPMPPAMPPPMPPPFEPGSVDPPAVPTAGEPVPTVEDRSRDGAKANGNGRFNGHGYVGATGRRPQKDDGKDHGNGFEPCDSDHLRGFADFPNAGARTKVRWG